MEIKEIPAVQIPRMACSLIILWQNYGNRRFVVDSFVVVSKVLNWHLGAVHVKSKYMWSREVLKA